MKKQVLVILLSTLFLLLGACSNDTKYIKEQEALELAKKHDNNKDIKWESKLAENMEIEINNIKVNQAVWVITATYPAGNKMIVYLDADNGKELVLSEIEANN